MFKGFMKMHKAVYKSKGLSRNCPKLAFTVAPRVTYLFVFES